MPFDAEPWKPAQQEPTKQFPLCRVAVAGVMLGVALGVFVFKGDIESLFGVFMGSYFNLLGVLFLFGGTWYALPEVTALFGLTSWGAFIIRSLLLISAAIIFIVLIARGAAVALGIG